MSTDFDSLAAQALAAYPKDGVELTFIQHSENVTYRVTHQRKTFLLRLHSPRRPEMGAHGADPAMIESELLWLDALKRARLPVPAAIRNRAGERVTRLDGERTTLNATLLTWLDGQDYTREFESEKPRPRPAPCSDACTNTPAAGASQKPSPAPSAAWTGSAPRLTACAPPSKMAASPTPTCANSRTRWKPWLFTSAVCAKPARPGA
jgi:hypothetical protein